MSCGALRSLSVYKRERLCTKYSFVWESPNLRQLAHLLAAPLHIVHLSHIIYLS